MNKTSRDIQDRLVHHHPVHTKNDINSLTFQDNKIGRKYSPSKLEWDFTGHTISNHSASGSVDRIRHFGSTESRLSLLSTGYAHEVMRSSIIKQYNDWVLIQEERTSKNFLTRRNILDHNEVGTTNPRRRCVDHRLLLTAKR
jgi:hypothetical protein